MMNQTRAFSSLKAVGRILPKTLSGAGRHAKTIARSEDTQAPARKRLTRENEPTEAWGSKFEKDGANPLSDPVAILGIFSILFPFLLLIVLIATGVIEIPAR